MTILTAPQGGAPAPDLDGAEIAVDGPAVVHQYLADLRALVGALDVPALGRIVETVTRALVDGHTVFLAGNGGSATAGEHMVVDWTSAAAVGGWRTSVVNLAGSAARLTALGNDFHFTEVFSRQLDACAAEGDLLVMMSVSGSSPNLVRAAQTAAGRGMGRIGLLGHPGDLTEHCDHLALIGRGDYGLVEDLHVAVNHMVARALRGGAAHVYRPDGGEDA